MANNGCTGANGIIASLGERVDERLRSLSSIRFFLPPQTSTCHTSTHVMHIAIYIYIVEFHDNDLGHICYVSRFVETPFFNLFQTSKVAGTNNDSPEAYPLPG